MNIKYKISSRKYSCLIVISLLITAHFIGSAAEKTEIKSSKILTVKAARNNYPFSYFDTEGNPAGFHIDIIREIALVMNLEIAVELNSWNTIRQELEHDRIDIVMGMINNKLSREKVLLTDAHYITSYYIFAGIDSDINSEGDLRGRKIIIQDYDLVYDYLIMNNVTDRIITAPDWEKSLIKLSNGEGDCVIMPVLQGNIILGKKGIKNITSRGNPLFQESYSMAVTKKNSQLQAVLNDGLRIIRLSGKYNSIYEKWFRHSHGRSLMGSRAFWILAITLLILATATVASTIWSKTLKDKITSQTEKLRIELTKKNRIQKKLENTLIEKEEMNAMATSARIEAEKASEAKSRFIAKVSHELRTPLHGIIGMTGILSKTDITPEQKDLISIIESSAKNLFRIITDLLDLSKIAAGKMQIEKSYFNIEELGNIVLAVMKLYAEENGLDLSWEIHNENRIIYSDKERISQIIYNLLTNSIKYTKAGSVHISITQESGSLKIEVTDTGIGIPKDMQGRIFESFTQVNHGTIAKDRSLGLGLSIVRELVTLLNGKIDLWSEPEKGSRFTVTIPVEIFNKVSGEREEQFSEKTDTCQTGSFMKESNGKLRLFIADDESVNRLFLEKSLEKMNCIIETTDNGTDAVRMIKNNVYDIVLMDITMPGMTGFEATEAIRKYEKNNMKKPVPIIALTAHTEDSLRERCIEYGMNGCVTKPFSISQLMEEIHSVIL